MLELLGLALAAFVVWLVVKNRQATAYGAKTTSSTEDQILDAVEAVAVDLTRRYPHLDDEQIAQLVRDDLVNHRVKDPRAFKWATADTVGRLRRNFARAVVAHVEEQAERETRRTKPAAIGPTTDDGRPVTETIGEVKVTRLRSCPKCGTKNRGDAKACRKCSARLVGSRPE